MSKYALIMGLMLIALVANPMIAWSHSGKRGGHGLRECKADVEQYCSGVEKGQGRILACLKENQTKLSPDCQAKLPVMEKFHEMKLACQADREKYCSQVEGGKRGARQCMRDNLDLLSTQCRDAMEQVKTMRQSQQG